MASIAPTPALSLAKLTIDRVAAGLESSEAAGIAEIVELIKQLSGDAVKTSVEDLASMIGRDVVVTAKVIAAANTLGFNPSGVEISTISQAIHVIGFNKIRQLALALLLIENAERTLNPQEKREIAALALCSGLMAESVMNRHGSHEPEQAFICASLRNYGRLLMTTFMLEEYRQAREMLTEGVSEDEAFRRVFGLTPLELGHHLLACAHLPEPILKSLRALPPDALRQASQNPEVELLILADLSVKLGELALRADVSALEFQRGLFSLSARTGRLFGLDADGLVNVLGDASHQLNEFARAFNLTTLSQQVTPRIKARLAGEDPASIRAVPTSTSASPLVAPSTTAASAPAPSPVPAAGQVSPPPAGKTPAPPPASAPLSISVPPPAEVTPTPTPHTAEERFQQAFETGIDQLANLLDESPIKMAKVYQVVLTAALRGFSAQEGLLFVRGERDAAYTVTIGSGSLFQATRGQSLVRDSERTIFGLALQRLEDVLIYDATDPKIVAHIPPWTKPGALQSLVVLPIHENRRPFAILVVGWPDKKSKGFSVAQIRQVRSMLKLVGTARRLASAA